MGDTPDKVMQLQERIYANMPSAKRFKLATGFIDMGLKIRINALHSKHPAATKKHLKLLMMKELYNIDLISAGGTNKNAENQ